MNVTSLPVAGLALVTVAPSSIFPLAARIASPAVASEVLRKLYARTPAPNEVSSVVVAAAIGSDPMATSAAAPASAANTALADLRPDPWIMEPPPGCGRRERYR